MSIGLIVVACLFFIFATVLSQGKGAALIAGYNTLPASEKAKYDEVALCKFFGKMMYGITFSIVVIGVSEWLQTTWLLIVGIALLVFLTLFTFIYINTKNRFKLKH